MSRLGFLSPAGLVLATIAGLVAYDLIRSIHKTPPRRDR